MQIVYLASFKTEKHTIEKDIKKELERMKHKVVAIDDGDFDPDEVIAKANKADLFLFRTGGVITDTVPEFWQTMSRLQYVLNGIKTKKVFWFFDKIIGLGHNWIYNIEPLVDFGFLNDETFCKRHNTDKLYPLHMGVNIDDTYHGAINDKYAYDVAFDGPVYGNRTIFIEMMKKNFGNKFGVFNLGGGKEYADLCASAKIIVSPRFPYDNWFWSEKIYKTLGHGGFMVFPRLEGLKEEGIEDGIQFAGYDVYGEMIEVIRWWLDPNNEKAKEGMDLIKKQGRRYVIENCTYDKRLQYLLAVSFHRFK